MKTTHNPNQITATGFTASMAADVSEAIATTGHKMMISRWGYPEIHTENNIYRICAYDSDIEIIQLSNNQAQLIKSNVTISGRFANPVTLAAMLETMIETEVA